MGRRLDWPRRRPAQPLRARDPAGAGGDRALGGGEGTAGDVDRPPKARRHRDPASAPRRERDRRRRRHPGRAAGRTRRGAAGAGPGHRGRDRRARRRGRPGAGRREAPRAGSLAAGDRLARRDRSSPLGGAHRGDARALHRALRRGGLVLSVLLVGRASDPLGSAQVLVAAATSGLGSGLLAFAAMAILGHVFRITTVFELRELADPQHPLLRQLLLRTPGTYHHSLLVANLAERAAEVIGADSLVARVGAYYHDIGKMRNPSAFIENQTGTNPHDELDPMVSAGIVAAHIKDGLALAERYHLPPVIREVIPGHHGTSLVRYFYQLAQQRGQIVDEQQFRYPGPRARSKEAGIVMLADGTEAAVRSLTEKTPETIRGMVQRIVDERVADGQLDECELTLRDVQRIKDAFCELLLGVYHERIPYPEDRITRIRPAAS